MSERMVPRTEYIRQLDSFRKDVGLIKVITGVRRCGKSELMRQFRQHLMDDGVPEGDIIYVDLERKRYVIDSERMLYETIRNSIRSEECYILLDEVQLVKGWERVVTTARNEFGANVYITGSNSKMLSDELGTHIT
ncbi:MAG: AAA family ATPase, partial [Candidatus Methanomethylophilaceae archaeon]|nr:AAA family ATPase [Candidatus Methanomethylophilaceae archaeon]